MNIEIANRLVQLRKSNNLSQEALAEKLGISRQAVSKWERAEASPDTDNLILLARLYQISLDELLKTEDEIPQTEQICEKEDIGEEEADYRGRDWVFEYRSLPVYLIVTIVYFIIGSVYGAWHPGWLLFLLPPIWNSVIVSVRNRNALCFAYPLLATLLFLCMGLFWGMWHPGWIVYLTIPLYYSLIRGGRVVFHVRHTRAGSMDREEAGDPNEER